MYPNDTTQEIPYGYCECGCGRLAPIARQGDTQKGYVKGQPLRFIQGHHNNLRPSRPIAERFWEKVDVRGPDECWLWNAGKLRYGYGVFVVGSKKDGSQRRVLAHRFAYELEHGPIPDGKEACHKCDNPPCCNPHHIFVDTHKENMEDMANKGRSSQGERDSQAKLTADAVRQIRQLCSSGARRKDVAKQFGVSVTAIFKVINRIRWKHIE